MKKLFILGLLLCSAIILIGAQTGFAWNNFNQGCLSCHPTTAGTGLHTVAAHNNCGNCHAGGVPGRNVESSACIVCHSITGGNLPALCQLIDAPAHAATTNTCLSCHVNCTNVQPPANDDFDNATTITALPFTDRINTSEATSAADDPTDCYGTNASVWYELTSITDIQIQVDTSYSNYDTVVAVYTGTRGNLNLVACSDYPCLTLDVRAGETYYFMVTSWYGMGGDLVFNVDVAPPPPPSLTFDLQVDSIGFVNNGITTVSGTLNSSAPLGYGYVSVQVRQKAGRVFITGYNSIYTDGVTPWTLQVSGDIGPFKPGKVEVRAFAYGCTYRECGNNECAQTPAVSAEVRLQKKK